MGLISNLNDYFYWHQNVFIAIMIFLFAIQSLLFTASLIRNLKGGGHIYPSLISLAGIFAPIFYLVRVYF